MTRGVLLKASWALWRSIRDPLNWIVRSLWVDVGANHYADDVWTLGARREFQHRLRVRPHGVTTQDGLGPDCVGTLGTYCKGREFVRPSGLPTRGWQPIMNYSRML
jgi:hypothetical protein